VNDTSRTMAATVVGAMIGATAGYLFFSESGRAFRRRVEPALEDFARELGSFRNSVENAIGVVNDGWRSLSEAFGAGGQSAARFPSSRQTAPF
jgi:gas vesicle protein